MNQNNVARPCYDEDAEMDYTGIPYADFPEPDEIDLYLQREREEREELWKPGEVWRRALRDANGGLKALWDAETPGLARKQVG